MIESSHSNGAMFPAAMTSGLRLLFLALALACFGLAPGPSQAQTVPQSREEIGLSFAPVVKSAAPAVVNIYTKRVVKSRALPGLFDDPFFKRFFGEDFGFGGRQRERIQNSLGSGVIVDGDGLVVTNHHVIDGADEITVVLADRREFPAEVVVDEARSDLAVLRVQSGGQTLPFLRFRNSDEIEVGDLVLAIGNPFGVGQTVTSGIVSALARTQVGISDYSFFIQTDAAINPGNSGGALVTLDGRLVGINTAIYSRSGGSIGIGFAIPSNMVRTVVAAANNGGRIMRPWPGFIGQTVTPDLVEGFGLSRPGGVAVTQIYPGGPADQSGVAVGDIILAVDGRPVDDVESLRFRVATRELGDRVSLSLWRDRRTQDVRMKLVAAPEVPPRDEQLLAGAQPLGGAKIANLSPALAEEMGLEGTWEGVVIVDIDRGSNAARFGFRVGDILLALNEIRVRDSVTLARDLAQSANRWLISFSRNGRVRTVELVR